jgi:asparagine N-glycosylation enzyme membrane subunit Stt3
MYFLLLFTIGLLIMALFVPWWSLQGSSSNIETSSTFYLIPLNLVSITTTPQVIVGELSFFPEIFITIMMIIPILTIIVSLLAVSVLVVKKIQKKQWQSLLFVGALALLLISLVLFIGAMSAFAEVGVGSFIGNGTLDISIQGTEEFAPVLCQWGPGVGFWLYMTSGVLLLVSLIIQLYLKKKKNTKLL